MEMMPIDSILEKYAWIPSKSDLIYEFFVVFVKLAYLHSIDESLNNPLRSILDLVRYDGTKVLPTRVVTDYTEEINARLPRHFGANDTNLMSNQLTDRDFIDMMTSVGGMVIWKKAQWNAWQSRGE